MGNTFKIRTNAVAWTVTVAVLAVAATLMVTSAWSADAAPGDDDSTYVPTPGCRAFDLRPPPLQVGPRPTALGAGEVYTQQITGGVGECVGPLAIPADAVGVAMNVTVAEPTAQSNLRLFPANLSDVPLLSNLNFSAGQAPFPNKVDVALSPSGAIKIFNQNGSVFVLADIVGYYTKSSLTEIEQRLSVLEAASAANSADIDAVVAAQPFAVEKDGVNTGLSFGEGAKVIAAMPLTAPADGHFTVVASSTASGGVIFCSLSTTGTAEQAYERAYDDAGTGGRGEISGNRVIQVSEGSTTTVSWVCRSSSAGGVEGTKLAAIFTPEPTP
ncbi:MAG: hypothetical protein AAGA42_16120 [Actinomycetota bacterium]